jgi:exodeoxyribonuclease VII small subunit
MSEKNVGFEGSLARLEQIVKLLERGEVSLDESLKLYQEGTELVRLCGQLLDNAQMQVMKLIPAGDGTPTFEVFDDGTEE